MLISQKKKDGVITLGIEGKIDTDTSAELHEEIQKVNIDEIEGLVLDFDKLEYLSSAGLRELLIAKKKCGTKPFTIVNVGTEIKELFVMTGFDSFLEYRCKPETVDLKQVSIKLMLKYAAENFADTPILENEEHLYTWKEIDVCSQIIAYDLAKLGVKKGSHVGLCGANSINWCLTFYAIQKLGAIAMFINFNMSPREIRTLAQTGDITHFCYGEMTSMSNEGAFLQEVMKGQENIKAVYSFRNEKNYLERRIEYADCKDLFQEMPYKDDPCVMVFTSGSTGKPKGALLSSYNLLNAAASNVESTKLGMPGDKACLILPLFHIFGIVAGLLANAMAGVVMYLPKSVKTNYLMRLIEQEKFTVLHSVPTMILAIMNNPMFSAEALSSLRCTILSGAPVSPSQLIMMQEKLRNIHFQAAYGLTEMAPIATTLYNDTGEHIANTVGKPIANVKLAIMNPENKELCSTGVQGEIVARGENLMTCYYKAPIEDQSIDDEGWLHTGDMGFLDEEGYLHFTGRYKELIIRGGENIIPNEVCDAILETETVAYAKVFGIPDDFFGEVVAAAIVMKPGCSFDEDQMRTDIEQRLAKQKRPEFYVLYDEFPSLANGKVDMVSLKKDIIEKVKNR